jgi:hypothetical protein
MESKDYMQLLANEYDSKELSKDDFVSTLKHYAELYHKEQTIKTNKPMQQQTAVKQFWQDLQDILPSSVDTETGMKLLKALKRAKKMERQQIIDAYHTNPLEAKWKNIGSDYYNETFNK